MFKILSIFLSLLVLQIHALPVPDYQECSCKRPKQGPTGPAGPTGPRGPAGIAGLAAYISVSLCDSQGGLTDGTAVKFTCIPTAAVGIGFIPFDTFVMPTTGNYEAIFGITGVSSDSDATSVAFVLVNVTAATTILPAIFFNIDDTPSEDLKTAATIFSATAGDRIQVQALNISGGPDVDLTVPSSDPPFAPPAFITIKQLSPAI